MADFDPYYKWLGIPPKDQPPNHYRLLGIELFESDPDVIESAADQRMSHVRTFQTGQNSSLSQRILNELSAAKLCLLTPQKKADYDRQLREKTKAADSGVQAAGSAAGGDQITQRHASPPAPIAAAIPRARAAPQASALPVVEAVPLVQPSPVIVSDAGTASGALHRGRSRKKSGGLPIVVGALGAFVAVGLIAYWMTSGKPTTVATQAPSTHTTTSVPVDAPKPGMAKPPNRPSNVPTAVAAKPEVTPKPSARAADGQMDAASSWQQTTRQLNDIASWTMPAGGWTEKDDGFYGQGATSMTFKQLLPASFLLTVNMTVFDGMRPRMMFGDQDFWFGNEGFERTLFVYGGGQRDATGTPVIYATGDKLKIACRMTDNDVEFSVDGKFVARCQRVKGGPVKLTLSAGDSWSGGKVLFDHFDLAPPSESRLADGPVLSVTADANHRPETPGVTADRIVLWNQHNGDAKDRGTRECNVSLWRDGREVWRQGAVQIPWSGDADENVSVNLPPATFDRVRVEVTKWEQQGGGLAEIEVLKGNRNLALGAPAIADAWFDGRFLPATLTDGDHTSARGAFWLLPDNTPAWAEVDLAFAEPRASSGVAADKLVLWNTHNANHSDRGALACNVRLLHGTEEVWRKEGVEMAWQPNSDERVEIALPDKRFDRLRIEIPRWQNLGGGLSEVEVMQGKVNLASSCPAIASGRLNYAFAPATVADGITGSLSEGVGYWLAPDNTVAWIEIDLSCNCEVGAKNRELGQYRALVEKDWLRGLPWLARGDAIELRTLADADLRLLTLPEIDEAHAAEAVAVGDRWWELGRASSGPARQELFARATSRYTAAMMYLSESERARLAKRISQGSSSTRQASGEPIDLLEQIDVQRDSENGDWQLTDGVLVSPDQRFAKLLLPPPPAEEYQLEMVLKRTKGNFGPNCVLVVGGRQVMASIDGVNGNFSGLNEVDGKHCDDNESTHRGRLLSDGKQYRLVYTVRRTSVQVALDGKTVISWSGDPSRLSLQRDWTMRDSKRLGLSEYESVFRISKLQITPFSPQAASPAIAASPVPESKPAKGIDVLKQIDLRRDVQFGTWHLRNGTLIAEAVPNARLQVPVVPPEEYKITMVVKGDPITRDIVLGLPLGDHQVSLALDGWSGTSSGLGLIDGKPGKENETTVNRRVLADGETEIVCNVRKQSIEVTCNGSAVINWSGDPARLRSDRNVPDPKHIYLFAWSTPIHVSKFELEPLSGSAPQALASQPRNFSDLAGGNASNQGSRRPVPDDEALKKAKQEVQKKYGPRITSAKLPEQKRTLAQELAQKAASESKDDAKAYVLLTQAVDVSEAAGDLNLVWQTIDQLAKSFAVDGLALRQQSLTDMGKTAKSPDLNWDLADGACRLMLLALAAGDAATVKKVTTQAQSFAKRSKNRDLQKMVASRVNDAGKLAAEVDAVAEAREKLKTMPDDPQANLTVGHYELCASGDWNAALPKLAKSSDDGWKKLAADEQALANRRPTGPRMFVNGRLIVQSQPADAPREMALADGWWSRAEDEPWPGKHYLQMRAARYYSSALKSVIDLDRARASERLKTLLANDDGLPAWELFKRSFSQRDELSGEVVRLDSGAIETTVEYDGSIDVTLLARTTGNSIRLSSHRWGWGWNYTVEPNRWHVFHFVITPLAYSVFVDGVPLQTDTSRTPRKLNSDAVSIHANNDVIEIKKFIVRAID